MFFFKGLKYIRRKILIPLNVSLIIFNFYIRKTLFGFANAALFLARVDKNAIIPLLKKNGASIGEKCDIETGLTFHNCINFSNLSIGNNCHIGKNCFFDLREKVNIGDNVVVSMLNTFITHIDMSKSNLSKVYKSNSKPITVKNNSYLGACCTVLMGVVIEEDAFVAAHSLVNKNVEKKTVVGGIPVKRLNLSIST